MIILTKYLFQKIHPKLAASQTIGGTQKGRLKSTLTSTKTVGIIEICFRFLMRNGSFFLFTNCNQCSFSITLKSSLFCLVLNNETVCWHWSPRTQAAELRHSRELMKATQINPHQVSFAKNPSQASWHWSPRTQAAEKISEMASWNGPIPQSF